MCPIIQGARLGQRSEQQPFQLWPVGESGSHHQAEPPAACGERDGQGGQGPSASSPSPSERMLSLSFGSSLSNEENSCPCPQKADLRSQPLACSAFPLCCSCVRDGSTGPGTRLWALAWPRASRGSGSGPGRLGEGPRHRALAFGTAARPSCHHASSKLESLCSQQSGRGRACPLGAVRPCEMRPPAAPSVKGGGTATNRTRMLCRAPSWGLCGQRLF